MVTGVAGIRQNPWRSLFQFTLSLHQFENLRAPRCSPHLYEATATSLACSRGRNRRKPSEHSRLSLFDSPSSVDHSTRWGHIQACLDQSKSLAPVLAAVVAALSSDGFPPPSSSPTIYVFDFLPWDSLSPRWLNLFLETTLTLNLTLTGFTK